MSNDTHSLLYSINTHLFNITVSDISATWMRNVPSLTSSFNPVWYCFSLWIMWQSFCDLMCTHTHTRRHTRLHRQHCLPKVKQHWEESRAFSHVMGSDECCTIMRPGNPETTRFLLATQQNSFFSIEEKECGWYKHWHFTFLGREPH